jgi:LDH2 family malate/lactate/ureidoglycolate dehydrogenase
MAKSKKGNGYRQKVDAAAALDREIKRKTDALKELKADLKKIAKSKGVHELEGYTDRVKFSDVKRTQTPPAVTFYDRCINHDIDHATALLALKVDLPKATALFKGLGLPLRFRSNTTEYGMIKFTAK